MGTLETTRLDTDYLIVGAGAMGMGFADVLLSEDPSARLVLVDRRASPGGHWNDAYPFVRLHQPAAFYGLNSTHLGQGGADLASGPEVVAYYQRAMEGFEATGRVEFLAMTDYRGDGRAVSTLDANRVTEITAHRRIVDATYSTVEVPSMRPPPYPVDPEVTLVAPNGLPQVERPWERYVVIGAGKTGIDSVLFLLDEGVAPERIQWIVSNEAWLWSRASVQPGVVVKELTTWVESIVGAASVDEVFLELERRGSVCRIDTRVLPSKWRCATVDRRELAQLRRVEDVVRLGRVRRVGFREVELDDGTLEVAEDSLFVDCSANGLARRETRPVFSDGHITLQSLFMCQQTFSAAIIGRLELLEATDEKRNRICAPAPHPERTEDVVPCLLSTVDNLIHTTRHMPLWLRRSRLNPAHHDALHRYALGAGRLAVLRRRATASMGTLLPHSSELDRTG